MKKRKKKKKNKKRLVLIFLLFFLLLQRRLHGLIRAPKKKKKKGCQCNHTSALPVAPAVRILSHSLITFRETWGASAAQRGRRAAPHKHAAP